MCRALIKTSRSSIPENSTKISHLLSASRQSGGDFYKAMYSKPAKTRGKSKGGAARESGNAVRHREGDLVGEGAEKIGGENVGHRLLSKMGWAEGDKIGRTGGLDAPIVAIVKNTKFGLGAYAG